MSTPSFAQLIKKAIENRLLDVHTAILGKVQSYDAKTQKADIEPITNQATEPLPLLIDVPALFPSAGGYFLSFPVKPGDVVQVIFSESADNFFNERFSLNNPVFIPGISSLNSAHAENLVLGKNTGPQIHIDSHKIRLGSETAHEALALASLVKAELDKIILAFNSHIHGNSGEDVPKPSIAKTKDIASKSVVAE
jgi:hypothetical protein